MNTEPQPQPLGSVHLGSGEFSLVRWPVIGALVRPSLMLMNEEGSGGGGGECSEQLNWVLGHSYMMGRTLDGGPFQVHGEVVAGYRRVSLICWDGTQANTTVLDCVNILGFNVYVAEVFEPAASDRRLERGVAVVCRSACVSPRSGLTRLLKTPPSMDGQRLLRCGSGQ